MEQLELLTTTLDIRIRGEINYICGLIEHQLLRIIIYSKAYKEEKPVDLKRTTFAVKVDMAQKAIRQKDEKLLSQSKQIFEVLRSKVDYRNLMIHGKYEWNPSDLTHLYVWDIVTADDEDKTQFHELFKFELGDIADTNTILMNIYNNLVPVAAQFERFGLTGTWA
ncbi:hypothetical protein GWC95_09540 [Sediminibacterium roseum]|uniref:Apea-like HEPN domain-containing protein n=1 Tax=Sediminibacterium roseum TaxID=1978412 RepID=A0ABW9ZYU1_9BACT|nr:hypothetical protein [Sediminibacterium roseum]NCI50165.1 hypothetical protein [Sediminibacterium roseum]